MNNLVLICTNLYTFTDRRIYIVKKKKKEHNALKQFLTPLVETDGELGYKNVFYESGLRQEPWGTPLLIIFRSHIL